MNKTLKKLTSTFLMTTLLSTLLMTNAVEPASAQTAGPQVTVAAAHDGGACQLSPGDMALLSGNGWADWAVRLIDLGCVAGSAAAALRMTSPFVGAFCAGWAIGRYISG